MMEFWQVFLALWQLLKETQHILVSIWSSTSALYFFFYLIFDKRWYKWNKFCRRNNWNKGIRCFSQFEYQVLVQCVQICSRILNDNNSLCIRILVFRNTFLFERTVVFRFGLDEFLHFHAVELEGFVDARRRLEFLQGSAHDV